MGVKIKRVAICIVCLLISNPFYADPQKLLERMNAAFINLSYDGYVSYYSGEELASLRIVHKVIDGKQRERLVHLNGAPREIIRDGEEVACIVMPGDDLLALEQSIPAGPFARSFVRQFDRLDSSYMVGEFGEGRIAGRSATRLAVSPKDEHRYGYRLWLDRETSLLLRSELVDATGKKLEIFQFSSVLIGDAVASESLEPNELSGSSVSHLRLETNDSDSLTTPVRTAAPSQWQSAWLPPGFSMASAGVRQVPASGHAIDGLMYSDGLSFFSIFIEPMPAKGASNMVSQNGATVALTRGVRGKSKSGHFLITLVGEIPLQTAKKIISSVSQLDK